MPKTYGRRSEMASREMRDAGTRSVKGAGTDLGPVGGTRGKHLSPITDHELQGASATGGLAVTTRSSRDAKGISIVPHAAAAGPANHGVTAFPQAAHANRASNASRAGAADARKAIVGDGCPGGCPMESAERVGQRGSRMTPIIASIESVSLEEALAYLESAEGDELVAAYSLAKDRNLLEGNVSEPDDAEVHHALFLLRRARGLNAPSFDLMRVQLRRLVAA